MYTFKLVNGDWDFSATRTGAIINDQEVLLQEEENNLKSIKGCDNYCPDYGSTLELTAGTITYQQAQSQIPYILKRDVMQENNRLLTSYKQRTTPWLRCQIPVNLNFIFQTDQGTWEVGIQTADGKTVKVQWS